MAVKDPTFLFCIGAQKAGTTWLYNYFKSHPEVHVPIIKEMHYFNVLWDKNQAEFGEMRRRSMESMPRVSEGEAARVVHQPGDPDSYEVLRDLVNMHDSDEPGHAAYRRFMMKGAGDARCVADITPDYSVLGGRYYRQMFDDFDSPKFLYLMRDPVQRTWSHLKMQVGWMSSRGHPDITIDELLNMLLMGRQNHILARSSYSGTLFALSKVPKHAVKYMFYENLFTDEGVSDLCDFLDVGFHAGDYGRRIRSGSDKGMTDQQRDILRWLTAPVYRRVYNKFGEMLPASWDVAAMDAKRPNFLDDFKIHESVLKKAG